MTQCELILRHLRKGYGITQLDALRWYGCARLASRIHDLKEDGHKIIARTIEVERQTGGTARVCEYKLIRSEADPHVPVGGTT